MDAEGTRGTQAQMRRYTQVGTKKGEEGFEGEERQSEALTIEVCVICPNFVVLILEIVGGCSDCLYWHGSVA